MSNVIQMSKYRNNLAESPSKSFMRKCFSSRDLVTGVVYGITIYYYKYTAGSESIEYYTLDDDDISREELVDMFSIDHILHIEGLIRK